MERWRKNEKKRERLWKRPRLIMGLLAILQTNPDFNYCCAARCWDGGHCSVSQPLLTLMMDELVITSRPSLFFPFQKRAVRNKNNCNWRLKLNPSPVSISCTVGRLSSQNTPPPLPTSPLTLLFLPPSLFPPLPPVGFALLTQSATVHSRELSFQHWSNAFLLLLSLCFSFFFKEKNRPTKLLSLLNRGDPLYVKTYIRGWCNVNIFCSRRKVLFFGP